MGLLSGFKKGKERDDAARERDKLLQTINESIAKGLDAPLGHALCEICRYNDDPMMPVYATGIVSKRAQQGLDKALGTSIYLINGMQNDAVRQALGEQACALIGRADRKDEKMMAGVASLANVVAVYAPEGSELQKKAMKLWRGALETLGATQSGLQYAFAAASNAALGWKEKSPLRAQSIDVWDELVEKLSRTDRQGAIEEAKRVASGYEAFGTEAFPFRNRAAAALKRFTR